MSAVSGKITAFRNGSYTPPPPFLARVVLGPGMVCTASGPQPGGSSCTQSWGPGWPWPGMVVNRILWMIVRSFGQTDRMAERPPARPPMNTEHKLRRRSRATPALWGGGRHPPIIAPGHATSLAQDQRTPASRPGQDATEPGPQSGLSGIGIGRRQLLESGRDKNLSS